MSQFKKNSPGCGCCPPPTRAISGTIIGCGIRALAMATVDFSVGGTSVATFTTDSSGVYSGTIAPGTYTQTVTHSSGRFTTSTTTGVVIASGSGTATIPTRTMTAATGYTCTTLFALPLSNTLHVVDHSTVPGAAGTFAMVWTGSLWSHAGGGGPAGHRFTTACALSGTNNGSTFCTPVRQAGATDPPSLLIHYTFSTTCQDWVAGEPMEVTE
jgi:hypothetical protein